MAGLDYIHLSHYWALYPQWRQDANSVTEQVKRKWAPFSGFSEQKICEKDEVNWNMQVSNSDQAGVFFFSFFFLFSCSVLITKDQNGLIQLLCNWIAQNVIEQPLFCALIKSTGWHKIYRIDYRGILKEISFDNFSCSKLQCLIASSITDFPKNAQLHEISKQILGASKTVFGLILMKNDTWKIVTYSYDLVFVCFPNYMHCCNIL